MFSVGQTIRRQTVTRRHFNK